MTESAVKLARCGLLDSEEFESPQAWRDAQYEMALLLIDRYHEFYDEEE